MLVLFGERLAIFVNQRSGAFLARASLVTNLGGFVLIVNFVCHSEKYKTVGTGLVPARLRGSEIAGSHEGCPCRSAVSVRHSIPSLSLRVLTPNHHLNDCARPNAAARFNLAAL